MSEETHNTAVTQPQTTQPTGQVASSKQPTAPVKVPEPVKAQTTLSSVAVKTTEPSKTQAVQSTATVKAPDTVKPQTVQPTSTVKTTGPVQLQPTGNTVPTAPTTVKAPTAQPTSLAKSPDTVTPQPTQPTVQAPESVQSQPVKPTEIPKLSDVVPTSKVWISGLIGNRQIDCLGPIEIPLKIDEPTYPFTPVSSNPNYTNQVFDYGTSTWVPTDAKSQGQQLTDLTKEVTDLQQTIAKHEKDAEKSQEVSLQQMQMLTSIASQLDVLTKKEGTK